MKRILYLLAFLLFPFSAHAQLSNCMGVTFEQTGDVSSYGDFVLGNDKYIASETLTYTVRCYNTSSGATVSTPSNSATGKGIGALTAGGSEVRCPPIFELRGVSATYGTPSFFEQDVINGRWNGTILSGIVATGNSCVPPSTSYDQISKTICGTILCRYSSPIVIDTTGKGFFLTSATDGVKFDISGSGIPVQMAWTAKNSTNGFLALPGPDGLVHNGKQLFGNFTPQPETPTPNGFAALALYDSNHDGIIDAKDAIWPSLRLWIDTNHDGISTQDEMFTLDSLGINSISLHYTPDSKTDQYGNQFRYRSPMNPDHPDEVGRFAYDIFFLINCAP